MHNKWTAFARIFMYRKRLQDAAVLGHWPFGSIYITHPCQELANWFGNPPCLLWGNFLDARSIIQPLISRGDKVQRLGGCLGLELLRNTNVSLEYHIKFAKSEGRLPRVSMIYNAQPQYRADLLPGVVLKRSTIAERSTGMQILATIPVE